MIKHKRILGFAASAILWVLLVMAGCSRPAEEPALTTVEPPKTTPAAVEPEEQIPTVKLALKLIEADSTTYRVITEIDKSVLWESPHPTKPKGFTGGHTGNRVEMTFKQLIQSINDKGNAVAKITIEQLKCTAKVKDNIVLDFDSSREQDRQNSLSKLIGQSYTLELTPSGQVLRVIDAKEARAVAASDLAGKTAANLLSDKAIRERHTIPALPASDKNQLQAGGKWSIIKSFSFDMMGSKSYEKVYTLQEIQDSGGRRIAFAKMQAVPSTEKAKELHKEQPASFFANISDNTETYTGELKMDLTAGKVEECRENLTTEWFIVDPNPKENEQPAALRMTAVSIYSIEKID